MTRLLLNCDMGESFGSWRMGLDEEVMPYVDCANIACGFHASDPGTMRKTVALAAEHSVKIAAHPSYPDLVGFGRRSMQCTPQEVEDMVLYQIGALDAMCRAEGTRVSFVKPHGALYNDMMRQPEQLRAVMRAVKHYDDALCIVVPARRDNSATEALGVEIGVSLMFEAFADRAYEADGALAARSLPGAVHHDPALVLAQAMTLARGQALRARDGSDLLLRADTLCVHGDNPDAVAVVRQIAAALADMRKA